MKAPVLVTVSALGGVLAGYGLSFINNPAGNGSSASPSSIAETQRSLRQGNNSDSSGSAFGAKGSISRGKNFQSLTDILAEPGQIGRFQNMIDYYDKLGANQFSDEVRKLAERTTLATKDISELVGTIQHETSAANTSIGHLAEQSEAFSTQGARASESMAGITGLSQQMERAIATSALRSFVELAKMDHLIFKFDVYQVLMGLLQKQPDELAEHTSCRLGKWYYEGEGKACFSRLDGYRGMEDPHAQVHRWGREALALYRAGNFAGAVDAVARMEDASSGVLDCLERMAANGDSSPDILCMDH